MPAWDVICLSPHPDDAAYSVGGTLSALSALGRRVLVVTVCGGPAPGDPISDFAREIHALMGLTAENAAQARRAEDETALARLGVARREGGLTDAIYRPVGYGSRETLLGGAPRDELAVEPLISALRQESPDALLLAPLAAGGHVDHVLVFRAARRAPGPVAFWEDFPYVAQAPESVAARLAEESLSPLDLGVVPDVEARVEASAAYVSQIPLLFGDTEALARAVRGHPAERLWR